MNHSCLLDGNLGSILVEQISKNLIIQFQTTIPDFLWPVEFALQIFSTEFPLPSVFLTSTTKIVHKWASTRTKSFSLTLVFSLVISISRMLHEWIIKTMCPFFFKKVVKISYRYFPFRFFPFVIFLRSLNDLSFLIKKIIPI